MGGENELVRDVLNNSARASAVRGCVRGCGWCGGDEEVVEDANISARSSAGFEEVAAAFPAAEDSSRSINEVSWFLEFPANSNGTGLAAAA